jgi:hypothetical protein
MEYRRYIVENAADGSALEAVDLTDGEAQLLQAIAAKLNAGEDSYAPTLTIELAKHQMPAPEPGWEWHRPVGSTWAEKRRI